ncbi:MAG: phage tail protein [Fibrobacteria bacterium]
MPHRNFLPLVLFSLSVTWPLGTDSKAASAHLVSAPFTIKVEIDGVTQGVFQSVEGLASQSEVIKTQEDSLTVEAPGALKGSRLILKRTYDPLLIGLWNWRQSVVEGYPQKRDGDIFIFTASGRMAAHWVFHKGWPCRWEVPLLAASGEVPAEEIIEIVHTGLTLEALSGS